MATKEELSGKWKSISGAVKQKYGQISDNDLKQVEGDLERLSGLIQQKTGQTREQVEAFYEECCDSQESVLGRVSELASGASEAVREGYDQVAEKTRLGYDTTVETVAKNPTTSLGVALGVGIAIGLSIGISIGAQRERNLSWRERWSR